MSLCGGAVVQDHPELLVFINGPAGNIAVRYFAENAVIIFQLSTSFIASIVRFDYNRTPAGFHLYSYSIFPNLTSSPRCTLFLSFGSSLVPLI